MKVKVIVAKFEKARTDVHVIMRIVKRAHFDCDQAGLTVLTVYHPGKWRQNAVIMLQFND